MGEKKLLGGAITERKKNPKKGSIEEVRPSAVCFRQKKTPGVGKQN